MTVICDVVAGYYEGVRTMACFALVGFLALLLTFDENKKDGWGVEKRPCIVAWVASECMHDHVSHMADSLPYCLINEWLPQFCIMHIQSGSLSKVIKPATAERCNLLH